MSEPRTPRRKHTRCNNTQKEWLLNFMLENKSLALGCPTPAGLQAQNNKRWAEVADSLAKLGPARSVEQWKITWRDLKKRARRNPAKLNNAGLNEVTSKSDQDDKIIFIIRSGTSQGIAAVPESPIGSVLEFIPSPAEPFECRSPTPPAALRLPTPPPITPQTPLPTPSQSADTRGPPCASVSTNLGEIYACSSEGIDLNTKTEDSDPLERSEGENDGNENSCHSSSEIEEASHIQKENRTRQKENKSTQDFRIKLRKRQQRQDLPREIPRRRLDKAYENMKDENDDEYEIFGKLIACKLKKIRNPNTRDNLMNDISDLVFRTCMADRTGR